MQIPRRLTVWTALVVLALPGLAATAQAEVSKKTIDSLGAPDSVETSIGTLNFKDGAPSADTVSYTHLRAHETVLDLVCRLLLEKKKNNRNTIVQK